MTKLQPHRTNENLVFEASVNRGDKERLSATTIFPYTVKILIINYNTKHLVNMMKLFSTGSQGRICHSSFVRGKGKI